MKQTFAIIGGDARQLSLAAALARKGAAVRCALLPRDALPKGIAFYENWEDAVANSDAVLLPLPTATDGARINAPLCPEGNTPLFAELLATLSPHTVIIGGKCTPMMRALAEEQGKALFDYCDSDLFAEKNAIPTAEGAALILMEREKRTIKGLPVAITGFGRVARALAELLVAMGASVTVGARREEALREAKKAGCRAHRLCGEDSVAALCRGKAAVFNTVPAWLFTKSVLLDMDRETLLIDLASAPGGVDAEAARGLGHTVIFALSLPGKYSPVTAGEIMADTVCELLSWEVAK